MISNALADFIGLNYFEARSQCQRAAHAPVLVHKHVGMFQQFLDLVVPRTVQTPLEQFRDNWRDIKRFLVRSRVTDEVDVTANASSSQLTDFVVGLFAALVEELEAGGGGGGGGQFQGDAMEQFLTDRVFETLAQLAARDSPSGIRRVLITQVTAFFQHLSACESSSDNSVLEHNSVHKQAVNLLFLGLTAADDDQVMFVELACALLQLLVQQPRAVGFFFRSNEHTFRSALPVFVPFHCLNPHATAANYCGERARAGLLSALRLSAVNEGVASYIGQRTSFAETLVADLAHQSQCYLARQPDPATPGPASTAAAAAAAAAPAARVTGRVRPLRHLRTMLQFANESLARAHPVTVAAELLERLDDQLLIPVLAPALLHRDRAQARRASLLFGVALDVVCPQLLMRFLALLGLGGDPDGTDNGGGAWPSHSAAPTNTLLASVFAKLRSGPSGQGDPLPAPDRDDDDDGDDDVGADLHSVYLLDRLLWAIASDDSARGQKAFVCALLGPCEPTETTKEACVDDQAKLASWLSLFPSPFYRLDTVANPVQFTAQVQEARAELAKQPVRLHLSADHRSRPPPPFLANLFSVLLDPRSPVEVWLLLTNVLTRLSRLLPSCEWLTGVSPPAPAPAPGRPPPSHLYARLTAAAVLDPEATAAEVQRAHGTLSSRRRGPVDDRTKTIQRSLILAQFSSEIASTIHAFQLNNQMT